MPKTDQKDIVSKLKTLLMMKKSKIKLKLVTRKLSLKLLKIPLNGWKVTKTLPLKNMNLREKNLKKNSNQSWPNSTDKVDKVDKCQIWEVWEAKASTCQIREVDNLP